MPDFSTRPPRSSARLVIRKLVPDDNEDFHNYNCTVSALGRSDHTECRLLPHSHIFYLSLW